MKTASDKAPAAFEAVSAPPASVVPGTSLTVLGAVVVAAAAAILPFVDAAGLSVSDNRYLNQGPTGNAGLILIVAAATALVNLAAILFGRRQQWFGVVLPGVIAMAIAAWTLQHADSRAVTPLISEYPGVVISSTADPGPAVWAAAAGGLLLLVGGLMLRRTAPAPRLEKRCPACAEAVLLEANVCKHCGERFAPTSALPV